MIRLHTRLATGALIAFLACQACQQPALAAGYAGRPIVDVLAELRGTGLDFIYSSDLLPRSLTVATEPTSTLSSLASMAGGRTTRACSMPGTRKSCM